VSTLRDDLLDPASYPAPRPRSVELEETHISLVFLAGDDVYKVKKPVALGFLDFTTREARERACAAEVTLNARLAPDVYRGVVPIVLGRDGRHRVGGDGAVVDAAVHMRRLPEERRADRLLRAGELGPERIEAVATTMARFHAAARADEHTAAFGAPEVVAKNVEENFAQTKSALHRFVSPSDAREIERFQRGFLATRADVLASRARAGRVRDGHGDLRLEHVYFEPAERVVVIDCIEFNERFRFADVCADIAFLAMDLAYAGRVDLAERLFAVYAREANDFDLYAVADFYESYRAFVRGKIALFMASDPSLAAPIRERAEASARRFFELARAAPRPPLVEPMLVAVGGVIASGKSTVADALSAELAAAVVDADRTRKWMLGVEATRHVDEAPFAGAYDPAFSERVYREVLRRADVVLASGRSVVLDASFRSASMRGAARDLARVRGVPFLFVECDAPDAVCRERLRVREGTTHVSDGRLAIFDDFRARFEPVAELPLREHVRADTSRPLEETIAALRERLPAWPEGLVA
jgi:aminoglycoside phosphotransferase family enzyme/predicted kinase